MDRRVERPRRRVPKLVIAVLVAVVLALVYTAFAMRGGQTLRVSRQSLSISTVAAGTFDDTVPLRGTAVPWTTTYIDSVEGGRVDQILVEDGATVDAGQKMLLLSNSDLELSVIARESEVTQQVNNLKTFQMQIEQVRLAREQELLEADWQISRLTNLMERQKPLVTTGVVSRHEGEATKVELDYWKKKRGAVIEAKQAGESLYRDRVAYLNTATQQLQSNLATTRKNLEGLTVTAPLTGRLTAFDLKVGQYVTKGQRIAQIDDATKYKISAAVDEFYLSRIAAGQSATLGAAGTEYALAVAKINSQVKDGQFTVELMFDGAAPADLRRGQTFSLNLALGEAAQSVVVDNGPFYQDSGGHWVFVLSRDGATATRREVKLGRRNAKSIEVVSGVAPGERVIVSTYASYAKIDRLIID